VGKGYSEEGPPGETSGGGRAGLVNGAGPFGSNLCHSAWPEGKGIRAKAFFARPEWEKRGKNLGFALKRF